MSQNGALGRKWPGVAKVLRRELGSFEDVRTEAPGDATRLAREAIESGADRVVAVGGDGTINEVVNGFFVDGAPVWASADGGERAAGAGAPALGIIPFGTGGDFRKTALIPADLTRAARILAAGKTRRIDLGKLEYRTRAGEAAVRVFINIASFGLSGTVDRFVNQGSKRLGGKLSFFIASARGAWEYENQRVRIEFDDDPGDSVEMTISTVAVANGRYFGGGMFVAPDAELDDGYFDVVAMGDLTLKDMIVHGRRIYKGTHLAMDKVSHRRARVVRAEAVGGGEVALDMDGETPGVLPATFRVMPEALSLVVPG